MYCQSSEEVSINQCGDHTCKCYNESIDTYSSGMFKSCILARKTSLTDFTCSSNKIFFYESGAFKSCWLAEDYQIDDYLLKTGTYFMLYESGQLYYLKNEENIKISDDVTCGGWGRDTIYFHENGQLKACYSLYDNYYQGAVCNAGYISFYDNGNVKICNLKYDVKINEYKCSEDYHISFYDNGALLSCFVIHSTGADDEIVKMCFDKEGNYDSSCSGEN